MKVLKGPNLQEKLVEVSTNPGVYQYKNAAGEIIYVGKAKNLRNRVRSYFNVKLAPTSKTAALVKQIEEIIYIETLSELEALILEAVLIKKHQPKYNVALKDDKSYLYIVIRPEVFEIEGKNRNIPKVLAARQSDLKEEDIVFGPYPHGRKAKSVVRTLRKLISYRDCSTSKFLKYHKKNQPCLYGYIGLCQAPCTNRITPTEYQQDINKIKRLLSGNSDKFIRSLEVEMKRNAKREQFEEAARYRDILGRFNYIRQKFSKANEYIENPYLVQDLREKSLNELKEHLPILQTIPHRIECYDISNISGMDAVGSMVVALDGEITKSEYRKFKIKTKATPDDFAMLSEVLYRRLKRQDWDMPDLIILDGGKGQLSAVLGVYEKLNIDIPIVGLAKKQETLVYFEEGNFFELRLDKDNEGLQLLQRLRDEAHRFAQAYHHNIRLKQLKSSNKK